MNTPHRFAASVSVFLFLTLCGAAAFACVCEKDIKPVAGSKIVFWGTATDVKSRGAQDRVSFDIGQLYKGDEEKDKVVVYTNRFTHDCGFRFEVGKSYLVYGYDFYPRGVATGLCWGTREAEEAPDESKWADVKIDVPPDSKLIVELRKAATKIVPNCGARYRLFDGGFALVLSPHGDPARPPTAERASEKLENFRTCVIDGFLADEKLPKPEVTVEIRGWYQRDVKQLPVLLDEFPCGDGCDDWVSRIKTGLLALSPPEPTDPVSTNLAMERKECLAGGIESVGGESHGIETVKRRRDRMLAECAAARGELDQAAPYIDRIGDPTMTAAMSWALGITKDRAEGAPRYPLRTGAPTFHDVALDKKSTFRTLRAGFFADTQWFMIPAYLEAFSESILADDSAPPAMRDLAALAYTRAGLLFPDAAEAYEKLASSASSSPEAKAMRDQLTAEHAAANAPPEEPVVSAEPVAAVAEVEEAPQQGQDPMLLVVAGVLILVAVAGIGTILKRR